MGQLRSATRAHALEGHGPAAVIANLERLVDRLLPGVSATVALACVDPASGEVRLARAGHLPPLVVRAAGAGHLVTDGASPPLGAIGDRLPGEASERLGPATRCCCAPMGSSSGATSRSSTGCSGCSTPPATDRQTPSRCAITSWRR